MRVIHVPIEPYPTRYTADWIQQFEKEFGDAGLEFITVLGNQVVNTIQNGSVLDACGTHIYKFSQLNVLMQMINDGKVTKDDVIFFSDLWFPGLESLFYVRNITGIDFKIAGIYHAGTWDPYDFTSRTGMRSWGQHVELSWLHGVDMIFVATQWHKDLIIMNSGSFDKDKIFVTGIPFYSKELAEKYPLPEKKQDLVVFPHRLDIEKHPEKFDRLAKKYPQWRFVKTISTTQNRDEYFKMLAQAKVMISFAEQETFGYSTVEAMALGCYVIVPNALSYRETVPENCRYSSEKEIPELLEQFMASPNIACYPELDKWSLSARNMVDVMYQEMENASVSRKKREEAIRAEQARVEAEKQAKKQKRAEAKEPVDGTEKTGGADE